MVLIIWTSQVGKPISFSAKHKKADLKFLTYFIGPLMVIVQKVTSLAFNIHDGVARKESELTKSQQYYAVTVLPTPLEYFSYVLQFPTIMAGPVLFYNDYMAFIKGENLVYDTVTVCRIFYRYYK